MSRTWPEKKWLVSKQGLTKQWTRWRTHGGSLQGAHGCGCLRGWVGRQAGAQAWWIALGETCSGSLFGTSPTLFGTCASKPCAGLLRNLLHNILWPNIEISSCWGEKTYFEIPLRTYHFEQSHSTMSCYSLPAFSQSAWPWVDRHNPIVSMFLHVAVSGNGSKSQNSFALKSGSTREGSVMFGSTPVARLKCLPRFEKTPSKEYGKTFPPSWSLLVRNFIAQLTAGLCQLLLMAALWPQGWC